MKILVVGSKGFIGSHLYRYLSGLSNQVWGCDVVTDYTDSNYFLVDATNANYEGVFRAVTFDACVNCSGASSVPDSFEHPLRDFTLNVYHVSVMLDAIRKQAPSCKFINLSSAAVYGNPPSLPVSETMRTSPLSPYGRHKLIAEEICKEYYRYFQIPTCSARIFSAYGPGLMKQIFWDWHKRLSTTLSLSILGTGGESRDFIFVNDIAQALNCILEKAPFEGETINVGNGEEVFIRRAVECFQKNYPKKFSYSFTGQTREGDPINWCADQSWLQANGYKQQFSFEEGIDQFIRWAVGV